MASTGGKTLSPKRATVKDAQAASHAAVQARAVSRIENLNEIARLLARFETVEDTFDAALAVAAKILPLESAVLIEDEGQGGGRRTTVWSPRGQAQGVAPAAREHAESAFASLMGAGPGRQDNAERTGKTALPGQAQDTDDAPGGRQFIVLPLVVADRPIFGALQMEAAGFDRMDLVFVSAIANQFAVALDRDRARRLDVARRAQADVMDGTLRAQAEALITADRQRAEFLSVLAAELRTSLGALREIQGSMRTVAGGERIDRAIGTMSGQIQRMAQLIDDLHGLSSLTSEQSQVRKSRVELCGLIARAAERGGERLGVRGQTLTIAVPPGPVWVSADAAGIERVLDTLIDKAALLASPGGRIWFTARIVAEPNVERALAGVPQVVVTLRDDGAGAVKAVLPRVFDLLNPAGRQLDAADGRFVAGVKLMRRIVDLHGGAVSASSAGLGQGSEFEVRLPIGTLPAEKLRPERRSS